MTAVDCCWKPESASHTKMPTFEQLTGEPADSFAQLLIHRDAGPSRLFRKTAVLTGCSESTLRRRAVLWKWQERLDLYDAAILSRIESESSNETVQKYKMQLHVFRDHQMNRARQLGVIADSTMSLIISSLAHCQESESLLQGREISSVLTASCKAIEMAMNTEAAALGVTELIDKCLGNDEV